MHSWLFSWVFLVAFGMVFWLVLVFWRIWVLVEFWIGLEVFFCKAFIKRII